MSCKAMAPIDLSGDWKNVKNENLGSYFHEAMNLNFMASIFLASQSMDLEISQDGDVFKILVQGLETFKSNITVGQEYTVKNPLTEERDTCLAVWDGDKLRIDSKSPSAGSGCVVYELIDGQLVLTQTHGTGDNAVVCKRIYDKK
ncbi:fatty acid-binding protein, heart-like [Patiria miniata]|uniref:Uncharacterized protein n=1 Tax=Patiria miniata TaxID=46514 RepID=A0A914A8H9_PATMI|nr:fatty acid-binding protein, heart-like [Patiria miniata]